LSKPSFQDIEVAARSAIPTPQKGAGIVSVSPVLVPTIPLTALSRAIYWWGQRHTQVALLNTRFVIGPCPTDEAWRILHIDLHPSASGEWLVETQYPNNVATPALVLHQWANVGVNTDIASRTLFRNPQDVNEYSVTDASIPVFPGGLLEIRSQVALAIATQINLYVLFEKVDAPSLFGALTLPTVVTEF